MSALDPKAAARAAHLRYRTDATPGIHRKKAAGKTFVYHNPDGTRVKDEADLARIRSLAIPPAWSVVWISPLENGHIQATGRDAKGRKQYRYHPRWREVRDETKYEKVLSFAAALAKIRAQADHDLKLPGLPRQKVVATVVRLLESTLIRVGNREYAVKNNSFGLTTMRDEHVAVQHGDMKFHFRGKSGKMHEIELHDVRLARVVARCQAIEGEELFQYVDHHGTRHVIESSDVNAYIRDASGADFTAKDFRTFAGTVLFAQATRAFEAFDTKAQAKRNVLTAITHVAERLGNTKSVCRKCYIHPVVVDAYLDGITVDTIKHRAESALSEGLHALSPEEAAVIALLREELARRANGTAKAEKKALQKIPKTLRAAALKLKKVA